MATIQHGSQHKSIELKIDPILGMANFFNDTALADILFDGYHPRFLTILQLKIDSNLAVFLIFVTILCIQR